MVMKKRIPDILKQLIQKQEESRYARMLYAAVLLLSVLTIRLFYVQIIDGAYYRSEADGNRIRTVPMQAPRGNMYDRNGILMAGSRQVYSVVIPYERKSKEIPLEELFRIGDLIGLPAEMITKKIEDNKKTFSPVVLKTDVGLDVLSVIEEQKQDFPDVEIEIQPLRYYPFHDIASHVLGYVGESGPDDVDANGNPYQTTTIVGRAGLEYTYNRYLEGKNGSRDVEVDATGRAVRNIEGMPRIQGKTIHLTIDSRLQQIAEDAIKKQLDVMLAEGIESTGASVVAVDPNTGAVLAMVSWPDFDPNSFSEGISSEEWNAILNNPNHPLENRPISSMYAPGSIFKVITGAVGLESQLITPEEMIFDTGRHWIIPKQNAQGEAFGWVNFDIAMAKSDNVYFYEVGRRVGIDRLSHMARAFGLGKKTGIDLPVESEGNVASEEYKKQIFEEDWYLGETFDAAIGQSYNLMTPLQMTMVYAAIANGGFLYRPYLVFRVDNLDGTPFLATEATQTGTIPVSQTNLRIIQNSLRGVMGHEGTGGSVFENYPIPIAGKSGTAETNGLDNAWFVAYAPFDKPEIVVLVMFEHAGFGSSSAAPVVKTLMDAYFRIGAFTEKVEPKQKIVVEKPKTVDVDAKKEEEVP